MATLYGDAGNNILNGSNENDDIYGKGGDDTINGGAGDDSLWGGDGADTFVFIPGHGDDSIRDFKPGTDIIDLSGFGGEAISWSALQQAFTVVDWSIEDEEHTGLQIDLSDWGGGTIILWGVTSADQLTRDSFELPVTVTHGTGANDTLTGEAVNDEMYGKEGKDTLLGRGGDDTLFGGAGDDELGGGAGYDTLTGGAGADTFVYNSGDGHDRITDFDDGEDRIDLSGFSGITDFSQLSARQDGDNVVIEFPNHGDGSITLEDFNLSDLDANDFLF